MYDYASAKPADTYRRSLPVAALPREAHAGQQPLEGGSEGARQRGEGGGGGRGGNNGRGSAGGGSGGGSIPLPTPRGRRCRGGTASLGTRRVRLLSHRLLSHHGLSQSLLSHQRIHGPRHARDVVPPQHAPLAPHIEAKGDGATRPPRPRRSRGGGGGGGGGGGSGGRGRGGGGDEGGRHALVGGPAAQRA